MGFLLPPGISRRYAALGASTLVVIWLWVAFGRVYRLPEHISWNVNSNRPQYGQSSPVPDAFDLAPINSESIKSVCGDTRWNESLVFTCDESVGGIGNIRNSILNCVRYAISAGAGLVVPSIVLRNSSDISYIRTGVKTDMSFMFDTQHFIESLRLSCPSMPIYNSIPSIPNYEKAHNHIPLIPESIVGYVPKTGLSQPEEWRSTFYNWLLQYQDTPDTTRPTIVELGRSYLQYPIYSDGEGFALSFGGILKIRSDARRLATKTLTNLAETYSFDADLSAPFLPNSFFGVHLRTEKDAAEGWPAPDWVYSRYDTQSKLYLEQAPRSSPAVIYVASGDLNEVAKFASDAAARNMSVTTKFDHLSGQDLEDLTNLAWDQQALVDFLVMMKAADFAGIAHSSFAWNIALKRHQYAQKKDHLDGPQMLSDELSQMYGIPRGYPEYAACLWP
jgi:hypothetical protein